MPGSMASNTRLCFGGLVGTCLPMVLWGCGYTTVRPFPQDVKTIHVEMLDSKEFRRELEFKLTEAVVKRIEMDTPYRIVEKHRADSILSGEIIEVQQRTFGTDFEGDRPRETASTIVMTWRWKNMRTGDLREFPRHVYTTTYIPPVGETFQTGMVRGLDGLAEQVVQAMETEW